MDILEFLKENEDKDLLRFSTAGSVDDGKSTLIGRLLHDSKGVYEDQLASIKKASRQSDLDGDIDYALLTDGLKAEREQGITIDVAYRYFSTPKRKFIIADTPGHEQYTRNMATGASTANLAVILIDARHGVLIQSKRHAFISSLLGIPHMLVAINKMDLVDYDEKVYNRIKRDFADFAAKLNVPDIHFIPISALKGDNVVNKGDNMPWYKGNALLDYLENVYIESDRNLIDLRFPVQYVLRPDLNFRGYAGQVASGIVKKGDEVMVLPSMRKTRVKSINSFDGDMDYSFVPQSVTLTLEDEVDISRGDMIVHPHNLPARQRHFEATVVWMAETPLDVNRNYLIKHSTQSSQTGVDELRYKIDVNTLHREKSETLKLNEIGRVVFTCKRPLFFDPYQKNRATGSFILIDLISNDTVAAGMIIDREPSDWLPSKIAIPKVEEDTPRMAPQSKIPIAEREEKLKQRAATIWLTGLVSCGKRSIAYELERQLFDLGSTCVVLDGSAIRSRLNRELDFTNTDRAEHLRRVAEIARILNDNGIIAICAFVSPTEKIRSQVAGIIGKERWLDVYVDATLDWCSSRDESGLYAKADSEELKNLPGVTSPYEAPENPALLVNPELIQQDGCVKKIIEYLKSERIISE